MAESERTGGLLVQRDDETPVTDELACGAMVAYSTRAPIKEADQVNEDSAAWLRVRANADVLAVADGAGGMPHADRASRVALESLLDAIETSGGEGRRLRDIVLDGIEAANEAVIELDGAASTIAVTIIVDGIARIIHAGDSPVLVIDRFGDLRHQTIDHTPLGYAVEAGMIDESEAMTHEARHIIANMLGSEDMRLEITSPIALDADDTVLLASDGLFDNLYLAEIVHRVRGRTLEESARMLAETAQERMRTEAPGQPSKPDDLTFVLYRVRERGEG